MLILCSKKWLWPRHVCCKGDAASLSLLMRVRNTALYGTVGSLGFGLLSVLCRFRLYQVRGLLLALNSHNTLDCGTARCLWSVSSLRALHLSDLSGPNTTLAKYSLCVVHVAMLCHALVSGERGLVSVYGGVGVVTNGSGDGGRVGLSAVVVSLSGVVRVLKPYLGVPWVACRRASPSGASKP